MTAPAERRCRRCGATSGLRLFTTVLGPREWECLDGCRPAPLPEMTAVPGEPLPPLPESAYPPGAVPLPDGCPLDLAAILARAEAATDGPWETGGDGLVWAPRMGDPVSGSTETVDAEFIAAARTDVVLLAREVERLRAKLDAARTVAGRHAEPHALTPIETTHLAGEVLAALAGEPWDDTEPDQP